MNLKSLLFKVVRAHADLVYYEARKADEELRDHCSELRRQVDIVRETAIQNIHKSSDVLIEQINEYQRECLAHNDECKKVHEETRKLLVESSLFLSQQQTILDEIMLDEAK